MADLDDWRLTNEEDWMHGAKLQRGRFTRPTPDWDHEHCRLCFAKFMEEPGEDVLHEGFVMTYSDRGGEMPAIEERTFVHEGFTSVRSPTDETWICEQCFEDSKEYFGWSVTESGER
jgi:hypothetical protein